MEISATAAVLPKTPEEAAPLHRGRTLLLLAGLLAALAYFVTEIYLLSGELGFPLDDSWIHLQFARNLAAGNGLSYNPGETVTGSTAPLWTALLALGFVLPGNPVVWAKVMGVLFYLAGIHATLVLARELGLGEGLARLAAGLTLATSWLVWSSLSGMEVPLFVVLSLWGVILHLRERRAPSRPPLSLGVLALAVLARPEGALLWLLALVDRLLLCRRDPDGALIWQRPAFPKVAVGMGLAACALLPILAFYAWAGGSILPTTFAVKASEVRRLLPEPRYLYTVLSIFFRPQPYATLLAGAGVVTLLARWGGPYDRGLLPGLWLLGLPLAYSTLTPLGEGVIAGNFGRYYFPLFPFLVVLAVLGLQPAAQTLGRHLRVEGWRVPLRGLLLALLLWPTLSTLVQGAGRYAQNVANVHDSDVRMARWLAERLPPEAVLAVNDIGAIKYYLPNRVVDLAGIASPDIHAFVRQARQSGGTLADGMKAFIAHHQPDYLVVFPQWLERVMGKDESFQPLYVLPIPDNITMGEDRIVVYATPWTRYPLGPVDTGS